MTIIPEDEGAFQLLGKISWIETHVISMSGAKRNLGIGGQNRR
jgi:hypothetical protein